MLTASLDPGFEARHAARCRQAKPKLSRRAMTQAERRAAEALGHVIFPCGSGHKRFAREIATEKAWEIGITEAQSVYLFKLRYRYRRQIPENIPYANLNL